MKTKDALRTATSYLLDMSGHVFDVLTIEKPVSAGAAINLSKVISKLSPLLGNLIEFNTVELLNDQEEFEGRGHWIRQDPGFPDAIFVGDVSPTPGFEIKAWFPLATEITARFRDSQNHFKDDNTHVCMIAWLPAHLVYGKPCIIDVCVASGLSVAKARDDHYHNPPDYLVLEPVDTTTRTRNLQQTNTSGHKWQGSDKEFREAQKFVSGWDKSGKTYKPTPEYQTKLKELTSRYPYRLDTNFAKIDRIAHPEIEAFKTRVQSKELHGLTVAQWANLLSRGSDDALRTALKDKLGITEADAKKLLD